MFVRNKLAQKLPDAYRQECMQKRLTPMGLDQFMYALKINNFIVSTAWRCLAFLGYVHKDQTKCYYTGKYESEEAKSCLHLEKRTYRWIQISEGDPNDPFLPHCYSYCGNGMREYHVDYHCSFLN